MDTRALLTDALSRGHGVLRRCLSELTDEELGYRPAPNANPIEWLGWHIARVEDRHVSDLLGTDQIWTAGGWAERFDMPADPDDVGTRHTNEQRDAVHVPDVAALREYLDAVATRTDEYMAALDDVALDRVLDEPQYTPLPTVGVRLVSLVHHVAHHAGQADYLRGLARGEPAGT
ncbi:MAG: DUF664 domain-containing protein [Dehalococcoidia bacterium]|nr:DUF664 domain-containing protein [Dehalococcoidia bacterium]